MRKVFGVIFLINLHFAFGQSLTVTRREVFLNIKEAINPLSKIKLTHAVKFNNEFYCFFQVGSNDNSWSDKKLFIIFSEKGKNPKIIEVPDEIRQSIYFDLFAYNDKVFVKTYMSSRTFYFDNNKSKWIKTKNVKDLIFEDENYSVYSLDFGEWGGKTWFKDKKTGVEYLIEITTPLVNKIGTTYYLTCPFNVVKIKDPLKLNKCGKDVTYENIQKKAKYTNWYGDKIGFDIVYNDSTARYHLFENIYRPHIVSSFVLENELLHIYETNTTTYISTIVGFSISHIQEIGQGMRFFDYFSSYRSKIQKGGQQLLKFESNDQLGFVEIDRQGVRIYNLILR